MLLKSLPLLLFVLMTGCANVELRESQVAPFSIDNYASRSDVSAYRLEDVRFRNTAVAFTEVECQDGKCLSEGFRMPIETPVAFPLQVENDLRRYFDGITKPEAVDGLVVNVLIFKAEAYKTSRTRAAGWIPIIGLAVPEEYKIGFNVGVAMVVLEHDRLVGKLIFDRRIEMLDPVHVDSKETYAKAIENYRHQLFDEIGRDVLKLLARSSPGLTPADPLKRLVEMHNNGSLTDAEFNAAKQKLLKRKK